MSAALPAMHKAFLVVNHRLAGPALKAGLGPLFSTPVAGSLMLLRTRGRSTGLMREAPLGYVIRDGAIYCVAGFGETTHWYRNVLADPRVECVLPTIAVSGIAERVTDRAEWLPAYRALLMSMGFIGRLTVGDVPHMTDDELEAQHSGLPLVRIRPTGLAAGPADPGGLAWLIVQAAATLWLAKTVVGVVRFFGGSRRRHGRAGPRSDVG